MTPDFTINSSAIVNNKPIIPLGYVSRSLQLAVNQLG